MSMPMEEDTGPISYDMIMRLRNAARQQMGEPTGEHAGAAARRLEGRTESPGSPQGPAPGPEGGLPPEGPPQPEMGTDPASGTLANGMTPDDMMVAEMESALNEANEPPDITMTAASTMMRYGAIQEYLARARGEL